MGPKNDEDYNYNYDDDNKIDNRSTGNSDDNGTRPVSCVIHREDFVPLAKKNSKALMSAVSSKGGINDISINYIRELMEYCKQDQELLQGKLSTVLEEDRIAR